MNKPLTLGLLTLAIVSAVGGGYFWGSQQYRAAAPASPAAAERPVLYWYDPMVPDKRFDKPGKSPFMDMQLVPRYADEAQDDGGVTISARQQQNLGVRIARAEIRTVNAQTSGYGTVALNERGLRTLVAPSGGIVELLAVNAPQQQVKQGETLATLWEPGLGGGAAGVSGGATIRRRFADAGGAAKAGAVVYAGSGDSPGGAQRQAAAAHDD